MTSEAFRPLYRSTRGSLVLAALIMLAGACESRSPTSPSTVPPPPSLPPTVPPSPPPSSPPFQLSGRVLTDAGVPIADAVVEVDHNRLAAGAGTSHCPSIATFCWVATRTNSSGEYSLEFAAGPLQSGAVGYVYAFADGYETAIQWVPGNSLTPVLDLRLGRIRPIRPGETTSVSVEPVSSLCTDLEDWWMLAYRCEVVYVEARQAGTLLVEARDTAGGSGGPQAFFFATSGNYTDVWTRTSPATLSAPVNPGQFLIFVGIPEGTATRRFDIVTSLR
jgi:hypothetical protein